MSFDFERMINMTAAALAEKIKALYEDPNKFVETALSCNTAGVDARIHDWFRKPPYGMFVTEMKFSEEYIGNKTEECFVRAMLADASMCEGKGRDIFKGVPRDNREKLLRDKIIPEYITPKDIRLTIPDLSDFLKLFTSYAEKNGIPNDKRERQFYRTVSAELHNAAILEIGGNGDNDHLYFTSKGAMVYIVNFGEWK